MHRAGALIGGERPTVLLGQGPRRGSGSTPGERQERLDEIDPPRHAILDGGSELGCVTAVTTHRITVRRMRMRSQVVALLATVPVVLTGCGLVSGPEAVAPSAPGPATSAPTAPAPESSTPSASTEPTDPSASAEASPTPDLSRFYDQKVKWTNCGNADCGTVTVPLDYDEPDGKTIKLAITRVKATGDPIGSLFVNPGGPGGSAVDYARAADAIIGPKIRQYFDVVGLDPRGVGRSAPVECMTDKERDVIAATDATPDTPAEEQTLLEQSRVPGERCAANESPVFAHVGTADAARDMDIARAVVGDSTLVYLGKSYGTMLGATYAELFPDRVGRMVLDGVLPSSLDLVEVTKGQADSFEWQVRDFVRYCLETSGCPLTGNVNEGLAQLQDWFTSLDENPLGGGDRPLNEALASYAVLANLYFPGYDYPRLVKALGSAMTEGNPKPLLAMLDDRVSRDPNGRYTDNSTDSFYAVTCLDRPYDGTIDDVKALAEQWKSSAPTFGPSLAWGLMSCKDWPATTTPVMETVAKGSNPILVVSTRHDPATPYEWGELVAKQLDNATLVTFEGKGHTAYGEGSSCVDSAVDQYLLKGTVPEKDLVCQ